MRKSSYRYTLIFNTLIMHVRHYLMKYILICLHLYYGYRQGFFVPFFSMLEKDFEDLFLSLVQKILQPDKSN